MRVQVCVISNYVQVSARNYYGECSADTVTADKAGDVKKINITMKMYTKF